MWTVNRGKYAAGVRVRGDGVRGRVREVFGSRGIDCWVDVEQGEGEEGEKL